MTSVPTAIEVGADRRRIAALIDDGDGPALVWLGGFRSDMTGSKAVALAAFGRRRGHRVVRFDYSGHGASPGAFTDGTIGLWSEEAAAVVDALAPGPVILVGSSMGGWMALLVALRMARSGRAGDVAGLVLVAPAPDFTQRLMFDAFPPDVRAALERDGSVAIPSAYADEPTVITRRLIEDGRDHALLDEPIAIDAPVRIVQGMADPDVPFAHAMLLVDGLAGDDVVTTLIKDGDHRLSRPSDIERILGAVAELLEPRSGEGL
ncbi:MAG TPA: alpha/beta hydrolase [Methylomirabilota bacterium]|nr:alpha/beta hydrolase [Methylomirabilota bacterium]